MYDFVLLIYVFIKHRIWIYRYKLGVFFETKIHGIDL